MKLIGIGIVAAVVVLAVNPSLRDRVSHDIGPWVQDGKHAVQEINKYTNTPSPTPTPATASGAPTPHTTAVPAILAAVPNGLASEHKFTVTNPDGTPGRWNSCAPINLIVNTANAPAGALADLTQAVAIVDQVSGLKMKISGTTKATPTKTWGTTQWTGAPNTWAPVLVAFDPPGTGALLPGSSGTTQPVWVDAGGKQEFVSGSIIFNSDQMGGYTSGFGTGTSRGTLMLHELGHLAGLAHVTSTNEVMYPDMGHAGTYGAGDLAGLRALGAGGCLPTATPSWSK